MLMLCFQSCGKGVHNVVGSVNYVKGVLDSKTEIAFSTFADAVKRTVPVNSAKVQPPNPPRQMPKEIVMIKEEELPPPTRGGVVGGIIGAAQNIATDWQATLNTGTAELHLVLHIAQEGRGYEARLDSIDQGANSLLVSAFSIKDGKIKFDVESVHGSYAGTLSADGNTIGGTWSQGQSLPLTFARRSASLSSMAPPPPPTMRTTTPQTPQRIRVGGNVQAANLIRKVTPDYPSLAKQARIQGTVRFTAVIGKDGTIIELQLLSGHPLLAPAAQDAVKQWVYKPTLLNGNPVQVITQIDVNFTLGFPSEATELPAGVGSGAPIGPDGPAIAISSDRLETFLRGKIGTWDLSSAKGGLGESGMKGPFKSGEEYTFYEFPTPGTTFSSVALRFANATGKLLNAVLTPAQAVLWDRQLELMKQKFPGDEPRAVQHGTNTIYAFARSRTNFEVRPNGYVIYVLIF